jgi:uncharacterized protein (TIRG00374 family)
MPSTPSRGFPWHTLVIVALTVGLFAVFLHGIDLHEAWQAVLGAHAGWIAAAVLVTLQTYVFRAWRWQILLRPIGRASFVNAFKTTVIGFAATFLLPARIGEVLRPYLLARREGFNPAAVFATIVVERLLDLCTVLLLFAVALTTAQAEVGPDVRMAGWLFAGLSVVGIGILFVLAGHPDRLGRWAGLLARRLPARLGGAVEHLVKTFAEGLQVMRTPRRLAAAMLASFPLWLSIALGIMLTSWAFDLTIPFVGSFLVVGYLTIGVAVPTPGGAGGFHTMYRLALVQFFHAPEGRAVAAAVVLHLVSFVPVTILGLLSMWQDGLTFGSLKEMKAVAQEEAQEETA